MSKNKLSKFENEIQNYMKEERNKRSLELFDKNEWELQIAESMKLDQYIYDLEHPVWKPIYVNDKISPYEVSNTGLIKNIKSEKLIKSFADSNKYMRISLTIEGKQYTQKVHRLVAIAFIPNPENKPQVNHINGKKTCNWVGNLEWNTAKENIQHANRTGLTSNRAIGERVGTSKYKEEQIHEVCKLLTDPLKSYKAVSNTSGVSYDIVAKVATGEYWKNISKDYNIPNREMYNNRKYNNSKILEVCELLSNGIRPTEINKITGISLPSISDIKSRRRYAWLSNGYNF